MTDTPLYKKPQAPVEERIKDLLGRMTTEEKVGQLLQLDGREDMEGEFHKKHPGSYLHLLGEASQRAIKLAAESRLEIPLILGIDAIHGHSFWPGATIFPTQLGAACSWNEDLIQESASVTAREMRNTGMNWTFSPVLCLARDLRWGRINETFGEDPYLIGRFAKAMIKGYQGDDMSAPDKVMATAKHYAGYSETHGGRDASEADISERKLRSYFFPPFKEAVKAGVGAFMTGYQSMEGIPSTANPWLLKDVLREEWGFDGLLVTDWDNVGALVKSQRICQDYKEAAALAVKSGNDMMMATPEFYEGCLEALKEGLLSMEELELAVARVLRVKFRLGLFEDPRYPDLEEANKVKGNSDHRNTALKLARESAVLLRNEGNILPLEESRISTIAVIGPNADDAFNQLGDWSLGTGQAGYEPCHPRESTITVLDGIKKRFSGEVLYSPGCSVKDKEPHQIQEAVQLAQKADVVIMVLGDQHHLVGEFKSTATLELQGGQLALAEAIRETGKPVITVLINSKPLALPPEVYNSDGVIELFNPGMMGGQALAELLMGDINFSGKLTISFPYHVGQQPVWYSQVRGQHGDRYADLTQDPLYAFGDGLSYTQFEYSQLELNQEIFSPSDTIEATVNITNTGSREGIEIVQGYISDLVTSATWVNKELKSYTRVNLKPGETKKVTLSVAAKECSIVNARGERVLEKGEFEIQVGPTSRDTLLLKQRFTIR